MKGKTAELRSELEDEQANARPVREEADSLKNKARFEQTAPYAAIYTVPVLQYTILNAVVYFWQYS